MNRLQIGTTGVYQGKPFKIVDIELTFDTYYTYAIVVLESGERYEAKHFFREVRKNHANLDSTFERCICVFDEQ